MTTRRGFLGAMLVAAAAPAVVKAGVLMPVRKIWTPPQGLILWGDGIHDDTAALQAAIRGDAVQMADGLPYTGILRGGTYRLSQTLVIRNSDNFSAFDCRFDGSEIPHDRAVIHVLNDSPRSGWRLGNPFIWRA